MSQAVSSEKNPKNSDSTLERKNPKADFIGQKEMREVNKREKSRLRSVRKGFLILMAIFLVGAFINFFIRLPQVAQKLNAAAKPLPSSFFKQTNLGKNYRENYLYVAYSDRIREVKLLSISPSDDDLIMITIPVNLYTNLPGRTLTKFEDFKPVENNFDGLLLQIQDLLAIPLDAVIVNTDSQISLNEDTLESIRKSSKFPLTSLPALIGYLRDNIYTNLTAVDVINVASHLRNLREDKVFTYTLDGFDFELEVNRKKFKAFDTTKIDGFLRKILPEDQILQTPVAVEVRNSTSVSGLGNQVGRFISNQGGQVVFVGNSELPAKRSATYVFDDKDKLLNRLKFLKVPAQQASRDNFNLETRGDVLVVLGQDYLDNFGLLKPK